jgi:aspartate aminotransferase-like enzyme
VLRAMSADLLGQFDPEMTGYMNQVMALSPGVRRKTAGPCWSTAPRARGSRRRWSA